VRHSTTAGRLFDSSPVCSICGRSECPGVDFVAACNAPRDPAPAALREAEPVEDVPGLPQEMNDRRMSRTGDHDTSIEAAALRLDGLRDLQVRVYRLIERDGPLTDDEIEARGGDPIFEGLSFAPTTLRKRRSELYADGFVEDVGRKLNANNRNMKLWKAVKT
jgi:hypothetical protein